MSKSSRSPAWQRALVVLTGTVVGVVALAALYWARSIFIPLALAIFLAFVLSPIVSTLQRRGLGRVPAVLTVVLCAGLLLGGIGWVVARQVSSLVAELPEYTGNIKDKIVNVKEMARGSGGGRFDQMIDDIGGQLGLKKSKPAAPPADAENVAPGEKPVTVVVEPHSPTWLTQLPAFLSPAAELLGQGALAIVLVVFMLLNREDMRNRLIRLVGHGRMTLTTKAVDDATQRISRYLLMQLIVNATYGLALGLGLFALGVHHAFLWGFLAAVLRYVPYVGAPVAALFPITLSVAMSAGWTQPLLVIGLVVVLEIVSNNAMEPWLYGHSMGVSEVAQLVSAAFWAFLWGPIGLVLSGPLTVCLLVLGKYVPHLEFLEVLLGDQPALDADVSYYQRLTAKDQDEATEIVLAHVKVAPAEEVYDDLLIPALNYTKRDRDREGLTAEDEQFILRATREILEDLGEQQAVAKSGEEPTAKTAAPRVRVLACPARDEADQVALEMLQQTLDPARWDVEVASVATLAAELIPLAEAKKPAVICIASLPPGGLAHTRYLCKRLRGRFPEVKIVVGRWGLKGNVEENQEQLREAGADEVGTTLLGTRQHLQSWLPVLSQPEPAAAERREAVAVG